MNERELRLLNKIADGLRAIQQDIHGIYEATRSQSDQQNQPHKIGVTLPPPVNEYFASEERERPQNTRRDQIRLRLEAIALLAALLAAGFTYFTLREIRQQIEHAEGQNRPWLKIDAVTDNPAGTAEKLPVVSFYMLPTTPKPSNSLSVMVAFHVTNIGKGVAQNVSIWPVILFDSERSPEDLMGDGEKRACTPTGFYQTPIGPPFFRSALFPGDTVVSNRGTAQPFNATKINHLKDRKGDFLAATLVACVSYQYPRHYQTIAVFHIMGLKDRFIEVNKPLDIGEMRLLRDEAYEYAQ